MTVCKLLYDSQTKNGYLFGGIELTAVVAVSGLTLIVVYRCWQAFSEKYPFHEIAKKYAEAIIAAQQIAAKTQSPVETPEATQDDPP
mgnify:FL=1